MKLKSILKNLFDKTPENWIGLCICESEDKIIFFGPHRKREALIEIAYVDVKKMINDQPCYLEYFKWPKARAAAIDWLCQFGTELEMAEAFAIMIDGYVKQE